MAGRRWAQGSADAEAAAAKARPRPSERGAAAHPAASKSPTGGSAEPQPPKPPKPTKSPDGKRAKPTPEQIAAARERLAPPKAPWHPLPLAELAIVFGFVAMLAGALLTNLNGAAAGFCLIAVGTAEFSWREHRHGYRSHATVLAASGALVLGIVLWRALELSRNVCIGAAIVVFLMAWGTLDRAYVPRREREAADRARRASSD
jgi:hypothetical protein